MGEFSDWGGMGLPGDTDVGVTGAGGDPYGGMDDMGDMGSFVESLPTGALPGGSENQFTPFSPNGGYDFTDVLRGTALRLPPMRSILAKQPLFGGGGMLYNTTPASPYGGDVPTLGTGPQVLTRSQADASSAGAIVRSVRQNTGLRVTARSIVGLIIRYGFPAAAALTKLDLPSLLALFMREKGVRHHRRGPGLYTIARKLRSADRLRASVGRILGRARPGGHRRRAPYHHFRRRSRRRR